MGQMTGIELSLLKLGWYGIGTDANGLESGTGHGRCHRVK